MKLYLKIDNPEKLTAIETLCKDIGAEYETISYKDLNRNLLEIVSGGIGNNKGTSSVPMVYTMPELIIFSGFAEENLDRFLKEYKTRGIEKVLLKAVVTPYNLNWSLYDLIEQLKSEANQMYKNQK